VSGGWPATPRANPRIRALLCGLLLATAPVARAAPPGTGIALSSCQLAHPITSARVPARCGSLEVLEDPARPDGRRIRLRVAVIPADNPNAMPDPVFVLAGGPGQAITEVYPRIAPAFDRLHRERDIVLVDQRGTGGSGLLSCPRIGQPGRDVELLPSAAGRIAGECARSLGVDLTRYGTEDYVRDLDAVRAALGYDRINLVGFSYGTRAALAYARTHPARARTLVLDGVAPFQMVVGNDFDVDSERALQGLFARCAAQPACRERYPRLEEDFRDLVARLDRKPERVRTRHPVTGEAVELTVDGDAVRQVPLAFLYAPETAALLPPLLRQARQGDLGPLAAQGILATADIQAGMSRPLQLSVLCTEDVPLYADPPPGAPPTFLGNAARDAFRSLCSEWPRGTLDPSFHAAPRLEVPALLLSGELDPVTPPRHADLAATALPASRRIVAPGQAHGIFWRGCVPRIAAEFVKRGSADALDVSCVERLRPSPIFLDLLGGAP
jgi:pimeloyl-ACP methyl ester carboxylesterase